MSVFAFEAKQVHACTTVQYQQGAIMIGAKDKHSMKSDKVHVERRLRWVGVDEWVKQSFHTGDLSLFPM